MTSPNTSVDKDKSTVNTCTTVFAVIGFMITQAIAPLAPLVAGPDHTFAVVITAAFVVGGLFALMGYSMGKLLVRFRKRGEKNS